MPIQHVNEVVVMLPVHKLYVGLSRPDSHIKINPDDVVSTVAERIESFTISDAQGYFRGMPEHTLVITIAHDDRDLVENVAQDLRARLQQEGVGLECDGVYTRITSAEVPVSGV